MCLMSYLCTFSKTKENSCESLKKKKTVDMNHTNANDVEDGDNDVLYDIVPVPVGRYSTMLLLFLSERLPIKNERPVLSVGLRQPPAGCSSE